MTQQLYDFISSVRLAESPEQEKFLIRSELADLRTLIREYDVSLMPRVVTKLLYLYIIGENISFAQLEPLTLMANPRFSFKRLGYIAAAVMIDETSELTILLTHTVEKDLSSTDVNIQCLALALVANIGSTVMCQTVVQSVLNKLDSQNSRVLKYAANAAIRIVERLPENAELFKSAVGKLLKNGTHSVVLSGIGLMECLIKVNPKMRTTFGRYSQPFAKILKQLNRGKSSREFEHNFFNDPFLQIRLLKILSILNKKSDDLDDVLESIITGVETKKNTGRALLFQAAETIVTTANKPSLRGLAFSQVGRLFSNKSPNVIYSALSIFSRILYSGNEIVGRTSGDSVALQRYKTKIVHCLNYGDPYIKRRALDVISALVDENNVETLVPEVLDYVKLADNEFRVELIAKIYSAIQRFAPNSQWNFNTVHLIIIDNGNYIGNDLIISFCKLISRTPELHQYAVQQLSCSFSSFTENQSLIQVSSWVVGEFMNQDNGTIFDSLKKVLFLPQTKASTKAVIITTLAKLAVRFNKKKEIQEFLNKFITSNNLEVQQRAGEMSMILSFNEFAEEILAPFEQNKTNEVKPVTIVEDEKEDEDLLSLFEKDYQKAEPQQQKTSSLLDDLSDISSLDNTKSMQDNKSKITPLPGSIEGLQMQDFILYFEIRKNPQNQKQIALRVSVFSLINTPLTNFSMKFGVPNGWHLQTQNASSSTLESVGSRPILQQIMVYTDTDMPLFMKIQFTYNYGTQPVTEIGEVSNIFN